LYGIVTPPNANAAFAGDPQQLGQPNDPLVGKPIGGVIVFAVDCRYTTERENWWAGLGVTETPPVPITLWRGKRAAH